MYAMVYTWAPIHTQKKTPTVAWFVADVLGGNLELQILHVIRPKPRSGGHTAVFLWNAFSATDGKPVTPVTSSTISCQPLCTPSLWTFFTKVQWQSQMVSHLPIPTAPGKLETMRWGKAEHWAKGWIRDYFSAQAVGPISKPHIWLIGTLNKALA